MSISLKTNYLGLSLMNPIVASASPLTGSVESLAQLEKAGVAAVVLPSLFEEQIEHEALEVYHLLTFGAESTPEAINYFPELSSYNTGPDSYIQLIKDAKQVLGIPVIASLNGISRGGWVRHAKLIQSAGADALELNIYFVPTNDQVSGEAVEQRYVDLVRDVREVVSLPLSVKIGPYFSSPANMAIKLIEAGANGLVLFNRFVQPDIDLETMQMVSQLELSQSSEARQALQWIGVLRSRIDASLAATGGVHSREDLVKLLLVGADVVMIASSLLKHGPSHVRKLIEGLCDWLEEYEYQSVGQMKGSMCYDHCPNPKGYDRSNYMKALVNYTSKNP